MNLLLMRTGIICMDYILLNENDVVQYQTTNCFYIMLFIIASVVITILLIYEDRNGKKQ